ncbi:MAG: hypothetical protein M3Q56_08580 [Bacteroidota bacterium]|nr:hypothetical protein [Bacteroidota bacterium]
MVAKYYLPQFIRIGHDLLSPFYFLSLFVMLSIGQINAQSATERLQIQDELKLPKSFLLGEYEQAYEKLINTYSNLLIQAYDNDLIKAFDLWSTFLLDMEEYAKKNNFELNGLKLWLNVFFNPDGTIQHIVYFPKPNSRNMQFELLSTFFISFSNNYHIKDYLKFKCAQYGTVSFPTFYKRVQ